MPHVDAAAMGLVCRREPWMGEAACHGQQALMFQDSKADEAKALCDGCPCLASCLAYAMSFGPSLWGVWGGLDQRERARLLRQAA